MSVGTFVVPDQTVQTDGTAYKLAIKNAIAVLGRLAGAFAPHEQSTPNMTVRLDAGALFGVSGLTEVAAQSTGALTAPVTHPRIDRVVIDQVTGMLSVVAGAEASIPAPPALPAGKLPVCQVALATSTTVITNSLLTDERVIAGASQPDILVGDLYLTFTNYADSAAVAAAKGYGTWQTCGFGRMLVGFGNAPIAGLTRAAACVCTWPGHGLNSGDSVTFSGITQSGWTALNSAHVVTRIDANSFSIPVNTSGYVADYAPDTDPGIYSLGSNFDTAGKTGGSATKNLAHTHPFTDEVTLPTQLAAVAGDAAVSCAQPGTFDTAGGNTSSGGSATQDVLNPYLVVYMWKRTG